MAEAKWAGVLSTTEPRNDVGIIKVRQGNINSEIAEFQIVQNNKPYDLTGLTVYFCASFGLNLVEKPAVVINTTGGRIQYTFDDDSMQSVGRQKGYFSIKKAESKIDSTQEFEFQVESSLMTRSIDGKSYVYKLSTLIKVLDDFIKNGQNNFNTWFDSVKEILYGVDPGGNILRELIEARKNSSGNIFASLKARLDKNEDDTAAQLAQTMKQTEFDSWVATLLDGGPSIFMETYAALNATYPTGSSGVALVRETNPARIYVWNGTKWEDYGAYQGLEIKDGSVTSEKIAGEAIKPDNIDNYTLNTDYFTSEARLTLPIENKGNYQIEMEGKSDIVVSNGNILDLLNITDGTYSANGLTVTVSDNHVEVTGTTVASFYFVLSDSTGSTVASDVSKKSYDLPMLPNKYALGIYNDTLTSGALSLCIRNIVSGNIITLNNSAKQGTALYDSSLWGSLYLFFNPGTYDLKFDIALQPVSQMKNEFNKKPSTKVINAQTTRTEFFGGYLFSENNGIAKPLSKIENSSVVQSANEKIFVENHGEGFDFYIKGSNKDSNKYIKYTFVHTVFSSRNADNWRLDKAYVGTMADGSFIQEDMIVNEGEWEMAIKLVDRTDFIGGLAHGSEVVDSILFYVDGIPKDILTAEDFYADHLRVITKSKMYDPNDETTHVANHLKVIDISTDGIMTDQKIEWLMALPVTHSYLAMLPIIRGRDSYASQYITEKGYSDDEYAPYDIGTVGWSNNLGVMTKNRKEYNLYAEESGISAKVEMLSQEPMLDNSISFVQNTDMYNKVYFSFTPYSYTTKVGEVWHAKYRYKLDVSK